MILFGHKYGLAYRAKFRRCVRPIRKACEHLCFTGAAVDIVGFTIHYETAIILLAGKTAFLVGAVGVYLMHIEEGSHIDNGKPIE